MCVIVVCDNRYPTTDELALFEKANGDGAGVAWMEGDKVRFVKGIDAEALDRMRPYLETRLPVVMHFRIATVGDKSAELCHPFPMDGPMPREVKGGLADRVLFHNGTWKEWYDYFADNLDVDPWKWKHVIRGDWSDSRFMAALLADQPEFIEVPGTGLEDQRLVLMDKGEIALYGRWETYEGLRVSNTWFEPWKPKEWARAATPAATHWRDEFDPWDAEWPPLEDDETVLVAGPRHGDVLYDAGETWMYDADLEAWMSVEGRRKLTKDVAGVPW